MQQIKNVGYVQEVKDGILFASGLSDVGYNEIVSIKTSVGEIDGIVQNLEEKTVGVVVLGDFQ
jgi:F-type H+-transporting ATPase subunit alpha